MTNKQALYLLIAAIVLAGFTSRWMLDGPVPAFNAVSLDTTYYDAQWVAFLMTAGAIAVMISNWQKSGKFPRPILLGAAAIFYFVATGIPQSSNFAEWARGDAGIEAWMGNREIRGLADEVEKRLAGSWTSENRANSSSRLYTLGRNTLTVEASGKPETFSPAVCGNDAYFRFGYATPDVFQSNPKADPYYVLLERPPVAKYEVACKGTLHTFLLRSDGKLVAFKNLHHRDPEIEILTRVP